MVCRHRHITIRICLCYFFARFKMDTLENCEETTKKFVKILQTNGITDAVSNVKVESAGLIGVGFASQSKYATITFVNPDKPQLNLFVKTLTRNEVHTQGIRVMKAFEKEARFLMEYLPEAKLLCEAKGCGNLLDIYPKCYYGDDDMIVLENLVSDKGYVLLDKDEMQDMKAAKIALTTLAKHHAISYAMIESVGGSKAFFQKFPNMDFEPFIEPTMRPMIEPMFNNGIVAYIELLEKSNEEGAKEALEMMKNNMGKVFGYIADILTADLEKEPLLVLNHGDYWNNNMMFLKDKETGAIIDHKAIDFQIARYHSPALDIGYYIFTSVQPEVRRNHLKELLQFYLQNLKEISANLGHTIDMSDEQLYARFLDKFQLGYWTGVGFSSGPVFAVMKNIDMNTLEMSPDMAEASEMFVKLISEWIDNNPEQGAEMCKGCISLVKEYENLMKDK